MKQAGAVLGMALCLYIGAAAGQHPPILELANFNDKSLAAWSHKKFSGVTRYVVVQDGEDSVLNAKSHNSASGLYLHKRVDLTEYPFIHWRWKIAQRLGDRNESCKQGDDFAARIYVVVGGGFFPWKTKAITYVWSKQMPRGSEWPNAFAGDSVMMHSVRGGGDALNTWHSEKRNLLEDMRRLHGNSVRYMDVLAIMSDTDNGGGVVEAWYDDIYLSKQ